MKENILKHLRPPEGQCRKEWERILSRDLIETGCDWLHWFYSSKVGGNRVGDAVSALCDRCEALEQENARLREELAKSRLTWSDEAPTEEGWYWVRPEGSSDWIHYLDQFILDRERRRKDDDKSMRFCRIPEPQEPSE